MEAFASLISKFLEGLTLRWRWGALMGVIVASIFGILLYEHFTGYFFYSSLSRKVTLLERVHMLETNGLEEESAAWAIYIEVISELGGRDVRPFSLIPATAVSTEDLIKWLGGASIWLVVIVVGVGGAFGESREGRLGTAFVVAIIAIAIGWIATRTPTFINAWVHFFAWFFGQLLIVWVIGSRRG